MIAAFLQSSVARLLPLGLVLLAIQATVLTEFQPAGVVLQIVLAFVAAAGVVGGPERGMLAGFVLGLLYDLRFGTPVGSSALSMGIGGMVAGSVTFINIEVEWWLAAIFVGLGAAAGEAAVPLVRSFTGQTDVFTDQLLVVVPIVALAAAVISPLLLPISRWAMRLNRGEWKVPAA